MRGKRSLTLPCQQLCPSAVGEGSALGSPAPTNGNALALQSSWRELQNAAGRAGTAGPHPAQLCHGAGIRREVSEAQERAGREEDAAGRAKPVTHLQGAHSASPCKEEQPVPAGICKAARACKRGQRHRGANAASRLGNGSLGQPGKAAKERPHTDSGKSNLCSHPVPLKAHTVLGTKLWRNGTSCVLTPPYLLPRMNQYILTSDSHTPGGMLWLGRGRKN